MIFTQSCSTEEAIIDSEATTKDYINTEKVTMDHLLSIIKNPIIRNHTETFKSNYSENTLQKATEKTNVYFTKIVKGDEYTTYLLLLNNYSTKNPYFMYYVITKDRDTEKVGYLKYIPDTPIHYLNIDTFSGKIQILDIKKKIKTESRIINGQSQKQANSTSAKTADDCTSTTSIITHYCGSSAGHSPGQECTDSKKAYYEVLIITICPFVSSYDNSAPVPNQLMNLTNGAGGGGANANIALVQFEQYLDLNQQNWWNSSRNTAKKAEISNFLIAYPDEIEFAREMLSQMIDDPSLKFDVESSFKSPFNIDRSSIKDVTEEDKKFNKLYDALKTSPEFKKLFIDLFDGDKSRINVKFEIADRVFTDNDTSKPEVNATTSEDPVTKNLTIRISKQLLIAGTTKSQIDIENAKTILHECIHAYLFSKAANPSFGANFATILNTMYPTPNEQHDFMYGKMIPTMQKVLGEIRDLVTTQAGRNKAEERVMFITLTPPTSSSWNWYDYYKYISLNGLGETSCFQLDFPLNSDQWKLLATYIKYGHDDLQP
ncbi:SprT-like domain-containing protein [Flavobacterium sp. CHNK8]|uniref:SprT-like domain-containing protein n=1 Tax=Flavobacterium sp. CHNK8 TaxID=2871165 RepID=UPI001C8E7B56|nr:SprT-like domain-containing protein [Flavobacterium sp. CHNK8]QZK91527.1 SprT-like domain-containing protein [Flavobacterium sp. CHNK8]